MPRTGAKSIPQPASMSPHDRVHDQAARMEAGQGPRSLASCSGSGSERREALAPGDQAQARAVEAGALTIAQRRLSLMLM
jgi:hypothetical protein